MFNLPDGAIATTTAYVGEIVTGYWELIALAIGIPLAFYIVRRIIGIVSK